MKHTGMTKIQIAEHSRKLQLDLNTKREECASLEAVVAQFILENTRLKDDILKAIANDAPAPVPMVEATVIEATVKCIGESIVVNPFKYLDIPGDFDGDGDVDGADLLTWQIGYPKGEFDGLDFLEWQRHFGKPPLEIVTVGTTSDDIVLEWEVPWVDRFVVVTPIEGFVGEAVVVFVLANLAGSRREVVRVTITVE